MKTEVCLKFSKQEIRRFLIDVESARPTGHQNQGRPFQKWHKSEATPSDSPKIVKPPRISGGWIGKTIDDRAASICQSCLGYLAFLNPTLLSPQTTSGSLSVRSLALGLYLSIIYYLFLYWPNIILTRNI